MTAERWSRVAAIVGQAVELNGEERARFVGEACSDSPELRTDVESFLANASQAEEFLENGAVAAEQQQQRIHAGSWVGPYILTHELGRGGMSIVFRGERDDDGAARSAAIKILACGLLTSAWRERFRAEGKILSQLQHPNIAMLYDAGVTTGGDAYLVMELVEGQPLSEFCKTRGLSVRQRLELFQAVCSAVHHAHQHLVVHRDLKPGNILVSHEGIPKLLDFGIAKVLGAESTDAGTATVFGVMTPDYASPEQIAGRTVTTASDVYSLGVVLYELLSGARPFSHGGRPWNEILEERAKALAPPGGTESEMNSIIQKALAFEPAERYGSARELAGDIENFLCGRPVEARPASPVYRLRKFVSRHRWAVSASAAALILLAASVLSIQIQRARAELRFQQVRKLANSMVFELHDKIAPLNGSTEARRLLVTRALEYLESLSQQAYDDPSLLLELSASYRRVAAVLGKPGTPNLGDQSGALQNANRSIDIARRALALRPGDLEPQRELFKSLNLKATILDSALQAPELKQTRAEAGALIRRIAASPRASFEDHSDFALQMFQECMAIPDAVARIPALEELLRRYESLSSQRPDDPGMRRNIALVEKYLGTSLVRAQRVEESLAHKQRAIDIDTQLAKRYPGRSQHQSDLRNSLRNMASSFAMLHRPAQAEPLLIQAVEISKRLMELDARDRFAPLALANDLNSYCNHLSTVGDYEKADSTCHESLRLLDQTLAVNASREAYLTLGDTNSYLGDIAKSRKRTAESCRWYRKAAGVAQNLTAATINDRQASVDLWLERAASCEGR